MSGINKSKQIMAAAKNFGQEAAVNTQQDAPVEEVKAEETKVEEVKVEEVKPQAAKKEKHSPWRESVGLSEAQLRRTERSVNCVISQELQLRLNFIKNRLNAERIGTDEARATLVSLQQQAIDEFTAKILKKWGYDV